MKSLQGVPWHIEKLHRKEGDQKRHRSRCVYYDRGECEKSVICGGSAHCSNYREKALQSRSVQTRVKEKTGLKSVVVKSGQAPAVKSKPIEPVDTLVQINNDDRVLSKIKQELAKRGCYHYQGLVENARFKAGFENNDVKIIYLQDHSRPVLVKFDRSSLEMIKSGNCLTLSFKITKIVGDHSYNREDCNWICHGHDRIYGHTYFKMIKNRK